MIVRNHSGQGATFSAVRREIEKEFEKCPDLISRFKDRDNLGPFRKASVVVSD